MAHIALIMTGLTGNLHASLEIASRLKEEGHRITYLAIRDVKNKVESCGFNYIQLPEIKHSISIQDLGFTNGLWYKKVFFHAKNKKLLYKNSEKILKLDEYKKTISSLKPDKVIVDAELHDIIFVSFALKIPIIISSSWFSNRMDYRFILPPIRTDIIPKSGIKGTPIYIFISWMFIKLKVKIRILINKILFKDYRRKALLNYAKKNNFPIEQIIASNLPSLFVYPHIVTLCMTMKEMDFNHRPYKKLNYVGPMVFESRDKKYDITTQEELKIIFDKKRTSNKKIIFCSVSTLVAGDISFIKKLIDGVKDENNWLVIITLGAKIDKSLFKELPNNVFLFNWVPQLEVLKNADININHGGINSINECIHYKVPMLVYSGKYFDQNGCAARVHYHGLGIMGDKDKDTSTEINHKLSSILNDTTFQLTTNKFHKIYLSYKQKNLSNQFNIEL